MNGMSYWTGKTDEISIRQKNFPDPEIGDSVRVAIPQVDLGKTDARNILAHMITVTLKFFKHNTHDQNGILKQLYVRS